MIIHLNDIECPTCGAPEVNDQGTLNIRAFKVFTKSGWWSQCLVCAGFYPGGTYDNETGDTRKGWFCEGDL